MPPRPKDYKLYNEDCLLRIEKMRSHSVDTIITDPPYGLKFMGKDWDHGIPGVPFWEAMLRVVKPGAMLLAFGGTRTHHRLTCAIEDAGWEIRDCLMWLYGSGFPKSANISKNIDKAAGAEREVVGKHQAPCGNVNATVAHGGSYQEAPDITAPATDAAKTWEGYGTALKPAYEPIVLAMAPLDGTFANNAIQHGVAGLNIDGGRIKTTDKLQKLGGSFSFAGSGGANEIGKKIEFVDPGLGRWPANLILSHTESCRQVGVKKVKGSILTPEHKIKQVSGFNPASEGHKYHGYADADGLETIEAWECSEDCPVRMLDEQSGVSTSPGRVTRGGNRQQAFGMKRQESVTCPSDTGGASRFFYTAKAAKKERNLGLPEGLVNFHPTVKPLKLLEYLCRLTMTPKGGVVFDPFMGSGSTGIACARVGRRFIGCENDTEHGYFEIAQKRVQYAYEPPE